MVDGGHSSPPSCRHNSGPLQSVPSGRCRLPEEQHVHRLCKRNTCRYGHRWPGGMRVAYPLNCQKAAFSYLSKYRYLRKDQHRSPNNPDQALIKPWLIPPTVGLIGDKPRSLNRPSTGLRNSCTLNLLFCHSGHFAASHLIESW